MRRPRAVLVAALGALALLTAGCGIHPSVSIGIRSTALDLRFARPDLAAPIPPNVIEEVLPRAAAVVPTPHTAIAPVSVGTLPPPTAGPGVPPSTVPPPVLVSPPTCPTAGGHPDQLAQSTSAAPRPGIYDYATKGTATVNGGSSSDTVAVPTTTPELVSTPIRVAPDPTTAQAEGTPTTGQETEYSVTTSIGSSIKQVDVLVDTPVGVDLVSRTLSDGQRTIKFTPSPEVSVLRFGPVGTSWKSTGSDSSDGSTVSDSGTITAIRTLSVCGQIVKAYSVQYTQQLVDPVDSEIISTASNDPNTFAVAPQLGGLVVAQHVDTSDVRFDSSLGGFIGISLDYTTSIDTLVPSAGSGP